MYLIRWSDAETRVLKSPPPFFHNHRAKLWKSTFAITEKCVFSGRTYIKQPILWILPLTAQHRTKNNDLYWDFAYIPAWWCCCCGRALSLPGTRRYHCDSTYRGYTSPCVHWLSLSKRLRIPIVCHMETLSQNQWSHAERSASCIASWSIHSSLMQYLSSCSKPNI